MKEWLDTISALSTVRRFSRLELTRPETVMEHTGQVALICLHIAQGLVEDGYKISVENLLIRALVHDIDESVSGDVQRPTKYFSEEMRDAFREMEQKIARSIFINANAQNLYVSWIAQKAGPEGKILAFVDALCVLIKTHDEAVMRGNKSIIEGISHLNFPHLREKLAAVIAEFPECNILQYYAEDVEAMIQKVRSVVL